MSWKHTARKNLRSHFNAAVKFFEEWAGYAVGPGETAAQARKRGAYRLAQAESEMHSRGWRVEWEQAQEPYEIGDDSDEMPKEVLDAFLVDENGKIMASLSQIADPSRQYGRLVEAELAVEAGL
jgi:hypothetical protein